jgi:rod shape-determining protein MreC
MATHANTGYARRRATFRRTAVALLALVAFGLLTIYLRESEDGALHRVQDRAGGLVAPVQGVAVAAIRPFQDAWGWMSDLRDARSRAAELEIEVAELRAAMIAQSARARDEAQLATLDGVAAPYLDDYTEVRATVDGRPPFALYHRARVDVGSADGVLQNAPVIAGADEGAALVGKVTSVEEHSADVSFITDGGQTQVGAVVLDAGDLGIGLVSSAAPGQLRLTDVPPEASLAEGQVVVTSGFSGMELPSVYPYGIPIGQITSFGAREVDAEQSVQVTPLVDPRELRHLVVLAPTSEKAIRRARG